MNQDKDLVCGALECRVTDEIAQVTNAEGKTRALCPAHRVDFLGRDHPRIGGEGIRDGGQQGCPA